MGTTFNESKKVRPTKDLVGKLVSITFLDHAAHAKDLCICRCVGWVTGVEEKHITVAWWDILFEDEETIQSNREYCSIIISTIEELKVLEGLMAGKISI